MALRIVLIFIISFSAYANSFNQAFRLYKRGEYKASNTALRRGYGRRVRPYPNKALMLMAKNYEKIGDYKKAIKVYFLVIDKRFRKLDREVRSTFKESPDDIDEIDELPKGLLKVYFSLFKLYADIYKKFKYEKYKKLIDLYAELLDEQDFKSDAVERVKQSIVAKEKKDKDSIVKTKYYLGLGYASWQDSLTLVAPNGDEDEVNSVAEGTSLFGVYSKGNLFFETRYEGAITFANSTVGEASDTFQYFQTNVSQVMLWLSYGRYYRPSANTAIGLSVPIVYRTGDFTQPATFTLEKTDMFTTGLFGNLSWNFSKFMFDFKFGKLLGFKSSYGQLSVLYQF